MNGYTTKPISMPQKLSGRVTWATGKIRNCCTTSTAGMSGCLTVTNPSLGWNLLARHFRPTDSWRIFDQPNQTGELAYLQALARPRHYSRGLLVVAVRVDDGDSGIAGSQRQSQGDRLLAPVHAGFAGGCASRGRIVRHELTNPACGAACAAGSRHTIFAAVSAAGVDFIHAAGVSVL